MDAHMFVSPIFIKTGEYLVQEVACVADAVDVLESWPQARRNPRHEAALLACYEAQYGRTSVVNARRAFASFAKHAGILEDPEAVLPWMTAKRA